MIARTSNQERVFQAALLSGIGGQAEAIASAALPGAPAQTDTEQPKTCIDGGGLMLFALHSARPGELGIVRRTTGGTTNIQPWLRTHYRWTPTGVQADEWQSCIFTGESPAHFEHAFHIARAAGDESFFRQIHAELGSRGRFIFAMQAEPSVCLPAWVGWQLDKYNPPATALKALGWGALWPQARALMQDFLGMSLTDKSRPWSIAVGFGAGSGMHEPLVRVGSTIWARQPEERAKHRRLARCIEQIGGDGRTVEALYKLFLPATIEPFTRVGRVIEIEFRGGTLQGASVLLASM